MTDEEVQAVMKVLMSDEGMEELMKNPQGTTDGIINTATQTKYPREGKQDRDAQILMDGTVLSLQKRVIAKQNTQNKCSEHLKLVKEAEQSKGIVHTVPKPSAARKIKAEKNFTAQQKKQAVAEQIASKSSPSLKKK